VSGERIGTASLRKFPLTAYRLLGEAQRSRDTFLTST